ncbi:MAG TPA: phosphoenolpyruvate carboxykinase domain-containing protein, partial [Nocardioides sp.]|nr:phosphoenolpyruvate carboxykinase domain-containing protein [Nocardioides sp.]
LLWLVRLKEGSVTGVPSPVGILPTEEELDLVGLPLPEEDLSRILSIDVDRWCQEMGFRTEHLQQFDGLPEEIWEAHRRVSRDLGC